ncbi:MAG TPA: SRPBCC domain-containing protein [Candidatus Acidoferrales bacterium]
MARYTAKFWKSCRSSAWFMRGGSKKLDGYGHELDTVVTWGLTPTADGGTRLHLEHSGFDPQSFAFKAMGQGWRGKVAEKITLVLSEAA